MSLEFMNLAKEKLTIGCDRVVRFRESVFE